VAESICIGVLFIAGLFLVCLGFARFIGWLIEILLDED